MPTWQVEVEFNGTLDEEQMIAVGESVASATFLETGFAELRFEVDVDSSDPADAVLAARDRVDSLQPVQELKQAGVLTGPHRMTVRDLLAHARNSSLVGVAEGAALMNNGQGVSTAHFRKLRSDDPEFPAPVLELASAEVWEAADILTYDRTRERGKAGRPPKKPRA